MAGIAGVLLIGFVAGDANPALAVGLESLTPAEYSPALYAPRNHVLPTRYTAQRAALGNGYGIVGGVVRSFLLDFYDRIHVVPTELALGNLAGEQTRQVSVWNAWRDRSQTLTETALVNGDGIWIEAPGDEPLTFAPLQERIWEVGIEASGPPVIDAVLSFTFEDVGTIAVAITGKRMLAWPIPPDWGRSLDESLAWLTEVQEPIAGEELRIPLREAPRRTWEFSLVEGNRARRLLEALLYDWSSRVWALPVWTDRSMLSAPATAGAGVVAASTAGLDFRAGGLALVWTDINRYELCEIASVEVNALELVRPLQASWPRGARLYPVRTAWLTDAPTITRKSDRVVTSRARFIAAEPCDWPAIAPATTYLGHPVLLDHRQESSDPTAAYPRDIEVIDGALGPMLLVDESDRSRPRQSHAWLVHGREQRAANRSLLYWLNGRATALWVPTGTDDLDLQEVVPPSSIVLNVGWAGVAQFLAAQSGRRHLCIERRAGAPLFCQVNGATEIDAETEQMTIDEPFGVELRPSDVTRISWMMLARQSGDEVEISHYADSEGAALVETGFVLAAGEEP